MRPELVIELDVAFEPLLRVTNRLVRVKIDLLLLDTFPESLHKHVIPPAAVAVHADLNPLVFQKSRELLAGELTPLVGVEDFGTAILRDRLSHGVETEVRG